MIIAVPIEEGKVFQHFGHTETFKIYEAEGRQLMSAELVPVECSGHDAIAAFLLGKKVNVVVCGGLGQGAQDALNAAGIEVISGAEGKADAAVVAYLNGNLESAGVNCDHHSHESAEEAEGCGCGCGCGSQEDEGCGCGDSEGGCGGGCGGCGGGCHGGMQPIMEGKNVSKTCRVHYEGTLNDGTKFDSSYDRGEPLEFVCGVGMMILGFDKAVANMEVGEIVNVHLMPEEAYGDVNPSMIFAVPIKELPGSENCTVGQKAYLTNTMGQPFMVTVVAKDEESVTFDANHEMAGKELNFKIELVEVREN